MIAAYKTDRPSITVARIAEAYPAEAAHTPKWERDEFFTDAQHAAWSLRFEPFAAPAEQPSAYIEPHAEERARYSSALPHQHTHSAHV